MGMYRQGLQFLAEGLANGLDGKTAYSFLQDLMAMRRQNQAIRADSSKSLMDLALGLSQQGYAPEDIKSVISQYAPNMPGLGARAEANLIGMAGNLPAVPMTGADAGTMGGTALPDGSELFDQNDVDALGYQVSQAVVAGTENLHTFRQRMMTQFRSMRNAAGQPLYNFNTLAYIYQKIGDLWAESAPIGTYTTNQINRIYGSDPNTPPPPPAGVDRSVSPYASGYGATATPAGPYAWGAR